MKPNLQGCKILIVDNSLMIVQRLNVLLTEINCVNNISTAYTFEEARDKLSKNTFDVVLLDTQLPDKNGFELLSFIKQNYPGTKTVLITNQASEVYRNLGKSMGADQFIDKSGEFEKLGEIIKEYAFGYEVN